MQLKKRVKAMKVGVRRLLVPRAAVAPVETPSAKLSKETITQKLSKETIAQKRKEAHDSGRSYFETIGLLSLLTEYSSGEIEPDFADLRVLHEAIATEGKRRPAVVLEFGVGFSTLVMAHAIASLDEERRSKSSLNSVDTSEKWIELTRQKIPGDLRKHVSFTHSGARSHLIGTQICSLYEKLPNVRPSLIYLDGPDPVEVSGDVHGLKFVSDNGTPNKPLSADVLIYEWSLDRGTRLIIDGRNTQARFLQANFKRRWSVEQDIIGDRHSFRLEE